MICRSNAMIFSESSWIHISTMALYHNLIFVLMTVWSLCTLLLPVSDSHLVTISQTRINDLICWYLNDAQSKLGRTRPSGTTPILGLWQSDQSDDNYLRKIEITKSVHEYEHWPRSRALRRFPVPSGIKEAWEGRSVTKCRLWAQTVTSLRQDDDVERRRSRNDWRWRCSELWELGRSQAMWTKTTAKSSLRGTRALPRCQSLLNSAEGNWN